MKSLVLIGVSALLLSGCTHSLMRGTVAMKAGKDEAHVCLGDNAVKKGDSVTFYKNSCESQSGAGQGEVDVNCKLVKLGNGKVERTLSTHYSLVKTDGSFDFEEGTLVQKAIR